jgi:hypothetical protein
MSLFKKTGVSVEGIHYEIVEEITMYFPETEDQLKALYERLNKQIGFEHFLYDGLKKMIVIDACELLSLTAPAV